MSEFDTGMNTTPGMWQMLSKALDGEQLPEPLNGVIYALCEGVASVVRAPVNVALNRVVFVYVKGQQVKARYYEDAVLLAVDPEWEHIGTFEPSAYIQDILETYPQLVSRMFGQDGNPF
jgi:hypothetical protein